MSTGSHLDNPRRRARPFRQVWKIAKRWRRRVGIRLGLLPAPADRGYMVCATPRSGSNYLCQLLASTNVLGNPLEFLNMAGGKSYPYPERPPKPRRQLDVIRSAGATRNGIYALKLLPPHYYFASAKVDLFHDLPNLKLVRLRRRDLLGQAISLARVRQTGQFMASYPTAAQPTYSQKLIRTCIRALHEQEALWDEIMLRQGVQPLTFEYEDVMRSPQDAVDRVAALMGLVPPVPIDPAMVLVTIQRNDITNAWRQRFLAETGAEFHELASSTVE